MSAPNVRGDCLIVRQPCVRCGHIPHTGEGKVTVSLTVAELEDLITQTTDLNLRKRLLCAIGLLDAQKERVLTRLDFATLDQVPAVEWNCEQTDYGRKWITMHSWVHSWEICEIDPGTQDQRCDAINEDDDACKSFITIDHAKRYVEIKLHLAEIERKLMEELVEK